MKYLVVLLLCLAVASVRAAGSPPNLNDSSITKWVEQLGNDNFKVRENATRRLLELEEVPPALRKAAKSSDVEVHRRAVTIIDKIEQRIGCRVLENIGQLAENGEFDQAIERLVRWQKADPEGAGLQPLSRLAGNLLELERRRFGKTPPILSDRLGMRDLLNSQRPFRYLSSSGPLVHAEHGHFFALRAPKIIVQDSFFSGFIASSGDVIFADRELFSADIFACGSVIFKGTIATHYLALVIVCDGDVDVQKDSSLFQSLIIARGNVSLPPATRQSRVIAGGAVKQAGQRPAGKDNIIREHDLDGLGLIKFFDPKRAGVEVTAADEEGVMVKFVAKDKPFAAGLRAGDIVLAVDGKTISSPDVFRKVLRATLAEERSKLTFVILRSGEPKKVLIPMKR